MLAAMAGINGAIFTSHFRQRMVLRHRARLASYIPSVVIPGLTTNLGQQASLAERLFSTKPECVPCSQISAVSLQVRMSHECLMLCCALLKSRFLMEYVAP